MLVLRSQTLALFLAAGLACATHACGGLYTTDPQRRIEPSDADRPGPDGNVPVDTNPPPTGGVPAGDARSSLKVGDNAIKRVGERGDTVSLGPASFTISSGVLTGETQIILTAISTDGSPTGVRGGALGPVFQVAALPQGTKISGSSFAVAISPESLGIPLERLVIAYLDQNGNPNGIWIPIEGKWDPINGLFWSDVWSFSGSRILAILVRCNSNADCRAPQTCSQVCQGP